MREYIAKKISSRISMTDPAWDKVEPGAVDLVWEDHAPSPYKTEFRLVHTEEALLLKMTTNEWPLAITAMHFNEPVCVDSCMEFFFIPNMEEKEYINLEMNPVGITLNHIGEGRGNRPTLDMKSGGVEIETRVVGEEGWSVLAYIPYSYLLNIYSHIGKEMRANFYKCGNNTVIPHYATWNRVELPRPDFHRSEFFGKVILSDEEI